MKKIGFCVCGSFCTLKATLAALDDLISKDFDVTPIFSFNVANLDTRFFKAEDFKKAVEDKMRSRLQKRTSTPSSSCLVRETLLQKSQTA